MVNFELSEKMKKGFLNLDKSMGQRKKILCSWGIKPQTFWFHTLMLNHWATETLQWARPLQSIYFFNREVINVYANMMMIETGIYLQLFLATFN